MNNKKFINKMEEELIPDNKDTIKRRLGIYEVKKEHHYSFSKPLIAFAMVVVLCIGLYPLFKNNFVVTPNNLVGKTYVSFDVNPSIEFIVDENKIVTTCTPKNNKAKVLLVNSHFEGKTIDEVTSLLVKTLNDTGFISITNKKNAIMVTTINEDESSQKQIQDTINNQIKEYFIDNHIFGVVINGDNVTSKNLEDEANKHNISVGKMKIINSIINNFDINDPKRPTIESLKDKKISELEDLLEELDDIREEALDEFEDDIEELLDLLEEYLDQYEDEEDEEELANLVSNESLNKLDFEKQITDLFNNLVIKWGEELLKNIIIDFNKIVNTIEQIEDLLDMIDDLDEDVLTSIDENNNLFNLKQFNTLKEKELDKLNSINKQEYEDDFDDFYEDWLEENTSKYEEDWFKEKEEWDKYFD